MTATMATTTTLLENLKEEPHHDFFLPPRSRRSSSRRSSGGSEGSRASVSSSLSYSSTLSTDSGSSDGIVKGLTILGVCLVYAFALFFIASLSTAFSYIFGFGRKGTKTVIRKTVVCKSTQKHMSKKSVARLPLHQQG